MNQSIVVLHNVLKAVVTSQGFLWSVLVTGAAVMAVVLVLRRRRLRLLQFPLRKDPRQDLTNMMILFQTMRDILEQQKDLARQLNASLDKKVAFIRSTVDDAVADLQKLRDTVDDLSSRIRDTKADLDDIEKDLGVFKIRRADAPAPEAIEPEYSKPEPPATDMPQERSGDYAPTLQVLAKPKLAYTADDVIDNWVGLDFGGDYPDPDAFDVPEDIPDEPEDAEAARDAFRALLNLESRPAPEPAATASNGGSGDNGSARNVPLQTRVYEYSDAGMSVQQIARELGLGKGEVRLILGLRKDKER